MDLWLQNVPNMFFLGKRSFLPSLFRKKADFLLPLLQSTIWKVANLGAMPIVIPANGWSRIAEWTEDELLDVGSNEKLVIYSIREKNLVQTWAAEGQSNELRVLNWIGETGNRKLAYRVEGGLELYDFNTNLKYRWGPGDFDHWSGSGSATWLLQSKGWIGGSESDSTLRFWNRSALI